MSDVCVWHNNIPLWQVNSASAGAIIPKMAVVDLTYKTAVAQRHNCDKFKYEKSVSRMSKNQLVLVRSNCNATLQWLLTYLDIFGYRDSSRALSVYSRGVYHNFHAGILYVLTDLKEISKKIYMSIKYICNYVHFNLLYYILCTPALLRSTNNLQI